MNGKKILATFLLLLILGAAPSVWAQSGAISGSPNPCEIFLIQNTCSVTIQWTSQGSSLVEVWVETSNGESLFARTATGGPYSKEAPWIQDSNYLFKLYTYVGGVRDALLSSVTVRGERSLRCEPQ